MVSFVFVMRSGGGPMRNQWWCYVRRRTEQVTARQARRRMEARGDSFSRLKATVLRTSTVVESIETEMAFGCAPIAPGPWFGGSR